MAPVPLFVELCAGTAALSVRLAKAEARPVISRMGAKTGYADAILDLAGLRPGQGAVAYLWCEPDPGARLLLEAYRSRRLALEAAAVIRGWADEAPRALWTRLKAEGPARHEPSGRELARVAVLGLLAYRVGFPDSGLAACKLAPQPKTATSHGAGPVSVLRPAYALDVLPEVSVAVITSSAVSPPSIPPGSVVYIDPPYVGTTGYAHDLPRAQVVELARAWAEAGALVLVSEAEPVVELVRLGWASYDIDERRGQVRTFSRQQREVVTMSRPAQRTQPRLFG